MNVSAEGLAKIRAHEGCVLTTYLDQAGLPTIGVGHLLTKGEAYPNGITQEQADALLAKDLERTIAGVNAALKVAVTQEQFDACVSLAFNIGVAAFRSSSALAAINAGLGNDVIRERWQRWNKVTIAGKLEVSEGLAKRRADEARAWP